ncbi:MAG: ROK family protein [Nitrososphaeria archaeon]
MSSVFDVLEEQARRRRIEERRYAIGVDLGATNVRVAIGDEEGRLLRKKEEKTEVHLGRDSLSQQIARMIEHIIGKEYAVADIRGIGIGSIGPLDPKRGAILKAANIPFDFVPLVQPLMRRFNLPVYLINDCTTAVIGEKTFGAGRHLDHLVYVTISTGIGGGAYVDNHVLMGKDNNAAEIGHFMVDMEQRMECGCGRRGHWEAYCSGRNIPRYVRMLLDDTPAGEKRGSLLVNGVNSKRLTSKMIFDAARKEDPLALKFLNELGELNAIGFSDVTTAYDPSLITVGGTVALMNDDLILQPIRKNLERFSINRVPDIMITPLGEDIVLYGAIAMVFHPPI